MKTQIKSDDLIILLKSIKQKNISTNNDRQKPNMKTITLSLIVSTMLLMSCGNDNQNENSDKNNADSTSVAIFGDTITETDAVALTELESKFKGQDSLAIKLVGKITDVCQKKGCWMMMDLGNDKTIRVTFKDYAFFVPKDAAGKTAVIDGFAYTDTVSVAQLKHYAEDAKKSKEEIEAITAPEINTSFEAKGVLIK
jgi:hypothetical protein